MSYLNTSKGRTHAVLHFDVWEAVKARSSACLKKKNQLLIISIVNGTWSQNQID